ncbi:MAG: transcription-repair coupling factor [Clostridiales Family XIII bacterium]|nr:transcription-repair coupling factor [Clostridiales Family XIII bacterium]
MSGPTPEQIHISGLTEEQIAPVLAARLDTDAYHDRPCLVITASTDRAIALAKALSFFSRRNVCTVAEDAPYFFDYEAKSRDEMNDRIIALIALTEDPQALIVAAASGAMKRIAHPDAFASAAFALIAGEEQDAAQLPWMLTRTGYRREHMVEAVGQYSVRGDILDVWPADGALPLRVSFFGDEVEQIRTFDPVTQRSGERRDRALIYPASDQPDADAPGNQAPRDMADTDASDSHKRCNMADYLPSGGIVALDDPDRITEAIALREAETQEDFSVLLGRGECARDALETFSGVSDIPSLYKGRETLFFTPFAKIPSDARTGKKIKVDKDESFAAKHPAVISGHMPLLLTELRRYLKEGFEVTIVCSTDGRSDNLRDLLTEEDLVGKVRLTRGNLASGIEITTSKKVWLWDGDIFKASRSGKRRRRYKDKGNAISSFSDIAPGDYIVHESHGIGKYEGLERLEIQGAEKDYLKIRYSGGDHLYVPVEQMSFIQKYIGGGESHPRVNKLSSGEWKRAKARVKADIAHMAADLAALAAERRMARGHAFSPDAEWQMEFEDRFPYDETEDQLKAIASIKADMEKPQPMDRLLCGDVGYGKTEVALRAVFKCAADGKQAAVLVPTTLLASQHYTTFSERFEDFPFKVEMLSRFRTAAEQKKIVSDLASGRVDVVIGTHRLLSGDIGFKDLGLLIIDEEHRFGVRHKEKIKTLRKNVDVLSLTATPIPRTLHLSLLGVRDMDLIEEPPEDRYPVQTYVMDESREIIRETVRRELDRKGQVFAVVSRIASLDRVAREIGRLVPEARIAAGHGRMNESQLEDTMADFIAGNYDVLVSTTIIESGLDIPNANTVLVFEADRFGLSQLYQIRGRVGRTNRMAFAYLLYKAGKQLSEVAEKRLRTIREFTEFGAGFRIAMRDLEIRGAGNLLGPEQHGHMAAVGYELYCRMVDEAIRRFAGGAHGTDGAEEKKEPKLDITIDAFIPESYITDEAERLEIYHRVADIQDSGEADEMLAELGDRYGPAPSPVSALIRISLARVLAGAAGVDAVRAGSIAELDAAIETLKTDVIQ